MFGLTPCRLLALGVLELALRDSHAGSLDARYFLKQDNPQLIFWCGLLGIQPATVRRAAQDPGWVERVAKVKAEIAGSWHHAKSCGASPTSFASTLIIPRPPVPLASPAAPRSRGPLR